MRLVVVAVMAAIAAAMAVPAFAAAPNAGCPKGFEEGVIDLGPNSNGIPSAAVNDSPEGCTKTLKADPQNPAWCCEPVIKVFRDDTVGGPK
jgi:hypothetical protein